MHSKSVGKSQVIIVTFSDCHIIHFSRTYLHSLIQQQRLRVHRLPQNYHNSTRSRDSLEMFIRKANTINDKVYCRGGDAVPVRLDEKESQIG